MPQPCELNNRPVICGVMPDAGAHQPPIVRCWDQHQPPTVPQRSRVTRACPLRRLVELPSAMTCNPGSALGSRRDRLVGDHQDGCEPGRETPSHSACATLFSDSSWRLLKPRSHDASLRFPPDRSQRMVLEQREEGPPVDFTYFSLESLPTPSRSAASCASCSPSCLPGWQLVRLQWPGVEGSRPQPLLESRLKVAKGRPSTRPDLDTLIAAAAGACWQRRLVVLGQAGVLLVVCMAACPLGVPLRLGVVHAPANGRDPDGDVLGGGRRSPTPARQSRR